MGSFPHPSPSGAMMWFGMQRFFGIGDGGHWSLFWYVLFIEMSISSIVPPPLSGVAWEVISPIQTAFVKGRYINGGSDDFA